MPFDQVNVPESNRTKHLKEARELLARPDGWCAHYRTYYDDDGTTQHCALGALDTVMTTGRYEVDISEEVALLACFAEPPGMMGFAPSQMVAMHNNLLGQTRTLTMFDQAIEESIRLDALAALV